MIKRATVLLSIFLAAGACDRPRPAALPAARHATDAPTTQIVYLPAQTVMLKDRSFVLEVAQTDEQTERGLMYRSSMPQDHGMLFVFADARRRPFWMKNTLIPLDIAYLDENAVVLNVEHMYPLDETGVPSAGDMKYAIELNQGVAERIGLRAGDHVALPAVSSK